MIDEHVTPKELEESIRETEERLGALKEYL
jgi:hypothetical protein